MHVYVSSVLLVLVSVSVLVPLMLLLLPATAACCLLLMLLLAACLLLECDDDCCEFDVQVTSTARQAFRRAVLEGGPRLVEAMFLCQVSTASEALSGAPCRNTCSLPFMLHKVRGFARRRALPCRGHVLEPEVH